MGSIKSASRDIATHYGFAYRRVKRRVVADARGAMARDLLLSADKRTPTTRETALSPDEAAILHFLEHQLHPA